MTPDPYAAPEEVAPDGEPGAVFPIKAQRFSGLDGIALLAAACVIAGLLVFPVGSFRQMFYDFGSRDAMPLATRFVLWPGSRIVLASPAMTAVAVGLRLCHSPASRRTWFAVAVILGLIGASVCLVSMYLPIFAVARAIKAE